MSDADIVGNVKSWVYSIVLWGQYKFFPENDSKSFFPENKKNINGYRNTVKNCFRNSIYKHIYNTFYNIIFLNFFFNNIIVLTLKRPKSAGFFEIRNSFQVTALQYRIFSPLQQHYSLPFARRSTYIDVRSS